MRNISSKFSSYLIVSSLARIHNQNVDFQGVDFTHCRGILIDGDHAIKWRQGEEGPSTERSVCHNPCVFFR